MSEKFTIHKVQDAIVELLAIELRKQDVVEVRSAGAKSNVDPNKGWRTITEEEREFYRDLARGKTALSIEAKGVKI